MIVDYRKSMIEHTPILIDGAVVEQCLYSVCSLATFIASQLYIACLFTVVLFLYLFIVHLTHFLHYWLEPVSKHFSVRSTPIRRT